MNWAISPTLDLFVIFLLNLFTSVLCMWVFWLPESVHHVSAWCPQRPEKGHRVPWDWCCGWVGTTMRVLRTEPESSGGAADVLNHWAVSSSFSFTFFFLTIISFVYMYVGGCTHATKHTWRSEDNWEQQFLSCYYVCLRVSSGHRAWPQVPLPTEPFCHFEPFF